MGKEQRKQTTQGRDGRTARRRRKKFYAKFFFTFRESLAGRPKEEKLREAMDADKPDHYEVLGITRSADEAEIKKAAHHPAD